MDKCLAEEGVEVAGLEGFEVGVGTKDIEDANREAYVLSDTGWCYMPKACPYVEADSIASEMRP